MKQTVLGFSIALLLVGMTASGADAAVGDVFESVAIPTAASCGGVGGTALAVLNGGKVNLPAIPILIVTTCQGKLFFLDPRTDPATHVLLPGRTDPLPISISPASLVFRADQGDLLACTATSNSTKLQAIDISPFNTVADGTVTDVSNGPSGGSCKGIAWEQRQVSNAGVVSLVPTIYQSAATGSNVLRYTPATKGNISAISLAVGCPANVGGVGIAGQSLFVGCPPATGSGPSTIRQVDKNSPATLVRSFSHSSTLPVALADDPATLGSEFKELLWGKDQTGSDLKAIEIPGGTVGQILGTAVAFPAACPPTYPTQSGGSGLDSDGDGLLDCWEDGSLWSDGLPGINFSGNWPTVPRDASLRDLTLCIGGQCANPLVRHILLELDWMEDLLAGHTHDPRISAPLAVTNVIAAFAAAPVPIQLLVEFSDGVPHTTSTALTPCTAAPVTGDASFDVLKANYFGAKSERDAGKTGTLNARAFVYHYGLFVHNQSGSSSSGCAEVKGNDLMVSLGSWGAFNFGSAAAPVWHSVGTPDQQEGTLMHEFGHNLGLLHGGLDHVNCKPNYVSVMSYSRQFSQAGFPRPLDYSRQELLPLNEGGLDESTGIGAFTGQIIFGPPVVTQSGQPAKPTVATVTGGAIDWNRSGIAGDVSGFQQDITSMAGLGCPAILPQSLVSFDDWDNLHFNFRASVDFASGASATHVEDKAFGNLDIQLDEALDISLDVIDIKPADPNNLVSTKSSQSISVAIFSRAGDAGGAGALDATAIDPGTLTLRGVYPFTWVLPVKQSKQGSYQCKNQDVNSDGLLDFVCQFEIPKGTISINETKAVIDGRTFGGEPVHASHFIKPN